jgi:hypothetical protein
MNNAGRELRLLAASYSLVDLVTWERQMMMSSYYDKRTGTPKQLDRIFVPLSHQQQVSHCTTIAMLVDSDHEAVQVQLLISPPARPPKTHRQEVGAKAIDEIFGKDSTQTQTAIAAVLKHYSSNYNHTDSDYVNLLRAVETVLASLPRKPKLRAGWCDLNKDLLCGATTDRNVASRRYALDQSLENKLLYKAARKRIKKMKTKAKNDWLWNEIENSNASLLPGGQKRTGFGNVWGFVKRCKRGNKKWRHWNYSNVRDVDGVMGTGPEDNATTFQAYYNDLFENESTPDRPDHSDIWYNAMPQVAVDREWAPPTEHEMMCALQDINNTAPGMSGIKISVWKAISTDPELRHILLDIMRECWNSEEVPDDWTKFYMTILEKKGDLSYPKNYRGISIAETASKIYTTILKYRLSALYEHLAPEYANGFRKGRGRADSITSVLSTLRARKSCGKDSYLLLFDVCKCFDRIKREHIWASMRKMGVSEKMIRVVQSTLRATSATMHVEGLQKQVHMIEGTGQGTTLGPILCNFFFLPMLRQWESTWKDKATIFERDPDRQQETSFLHSFADDIAIILKTREDAEEVSTALYKYLKDFLIDIHVATPTEPKSKSIAMFFPAYGAYAAVEQPLIVNAAEHKSINFVHQATYLGHIFTSDLTDDKHLKSRMSKASQIFGALGPNVFRNKQVWRVVKAKILKTMILPVLLDGAECCVISSKMMAALETVYHRFVRSCLRITPYTQRNCRLSSEKLLRTLGIQPLHHFLDLKLLAYAGHVIRMPVFRLPRIISCGKLDEPSKRGRPIKSMNVCINESLKRKGIPIDKWQSFSLNKKKWATAIRQNSKYTRARARTPFSRFTPIWFTSPYIILGKFVEKQFAHKWYVGTIIETNLDRDTNEQIWRVLYDDGDEEDYSAKQLQGILCHDLDLYS